MQFSQRNIKPPATIQVLGNLGGGIWGKWGESGESGDTILAFWWGESGIDKNSLWGD